jgi:hypothetical protein
MSYGYCFSKDSLANAKRKIFGRFNKSTGTPVSFFQFDLQAAKIEQCRARHGIDQQIQVAPVPIITNAARSRILVDCAGCRVRSVAEPLRGIDGEPRMEAYHTHVTVSR